MRAQSACSPCQWLLSLSLRFSVTKVIATPTHHKLCSKQTSHSGPPSRQLQKGSLVLMLRHHTTIQQFNSQVSQPVSQGGFRHPPAHRNLHQPAYGLLTSRTRPARAQRHHTPPSCLPASRSPTQAAPHTQVGSSGCAHHLEAPGPAQPSATVLPAGRAAHVGTLPGAGATAGGRPRRPSQK